MKIITAPTAPTRPATHMEESMRKYSISSAEGTLLCVVSVELGEISIDIRGNPLSMAEMESLIDNLSEIRLAFLEPKL